MGCAPSSLAKRGSGGRRRRMSVIPRVAVFVPSLRVPIDVDFVRPLRGLVPRDVLETLSTLRGRIVILAEQNTFSVVLELQRALEEYLPVLLGLTMKECRLDESVEFRWKNLEGDGRETGFTSAWFEVLCVVHFMAMLALVEANMVLVPGGSDVCELNVSEESKKDAIDLLLKASGYLDYCVHHIMIHLPLQIRQDLPYDLQDGVLEGISIQALGQALEMQLGLAVECEKATLSVKRRLACEEVSYYAQAYYCLSGCEANGAYGKKYLLFVKWKYLEAKAAAYYYHGALLDKTNEPNGHISAVNCFLAADEILGESKKICLSFCLAVPVTRVPSPWGVMKYLRNKVPEVASQKYQMYGYLFEQEKALHSLPDLPEFPLSLKSDCYELPDIDASWNGENCQPVVQSLKEHLKDDEDDVERVAA